MAISKIIKEKTGSFIKNYIDDSMSPPIDINTIIQKEGISVKEHLFEEGLSGILIIEGDSKTIGIEESHHEVRQRFTLAHELGHYILHSNKSNVFMDAILFKRQSDGYTSQEERIEQEANYFAANILMPESIVKREVNALHEDLYDDKNVEILAKKFNVSSSAMTFRLINLGLI